MIRVLKAGFYSRFLTSLGTTKRYAKITNPNQKIRRQNAFNYLFIYTYNKGYKNVHEKSSLCLHLSTKFNNKHREINNFKTRRIIQFI